MSVYTKLNEARNSLSKAPLKKSGFNKFAGYHYFELGDFLPTIMDIFTGLGLCGVVSYTGDTATLTIVDTESDGVITITSPMGSAALKGCHEVQNIGAVETYQRRYLWVTAMEIVENDVLDALPQDAKPETKSKISAGPKISPMDGALDGFNAEQLAFLRDKTAQIVAAFNKSGAASAAALFYRDLNLDQEEQLGVWALMASESAARNQIKKFKDSVINTEQAA